MLNLAIRGHATRGNEVIEILKTFGGINDRFKLDGKIESFHYYIGRNNNIYHASLSSELKIFTLEEFLGKYPYKIGDKVLSHNKWVGVIESMEWYNGEVLYHIRECPNYISSETVEHLQYYKDTKVINKEAIMEKNQPPKTQAEVDKYLKEHPIKNAMNVMDIESCLETDGLKLPENVVINSKGIGSIQFIQWYEKSQYPKTYEECCKILDWNHRDYDRVGYKSDLLCKLQVLLLCRDAYWEIASDESELGKPWEQDYDDRCFIIANNNGNIHTYEYHGSDNVILAFPTEEMRDAFYDNFKELIEQCKELL